MSFCAPTGPFDFQNPCIRASWGSLLPAVFVFVLCLLSLPLPHAIRNLKVTRILKGPVQPFLTLEEAEALDSSSNSEAQAKRSDSVPFWRTGVFVFVGLAETLSWLSFGSYNLLDDSGTSWTKCLPFFAAFTWLYTVLRPVVRPVLTAPLDLFQVYFLLLAAAVLQLGGVIYDYVILEVPLPLTFALALSLDLAAILGLLAIVLHIPFAVPSERVNKEDIGHPVTEEDYTTLYGWLTFSWIYPMVKKGRSTTLQEDDVWSLSPTIKSRPVFLRFSDFHRSSLLHQLWAANSMDIILDFTLTVVSVLFNYTSPFFLRQILDAIDTPNPTRESRSKAYIYAFLAFACSIAKSQADLQHLWFGRRVASRIRSELMAAIYDKALKRKDFSGIVDKQKHDDKQETDTKGKKTKKRGGKKKSEKTDEAKAGAGVGKIVNLMAGDASQISQVATSMYMIYGAPLEIAIAGAYLYQLLGLSAFAGLIVIAAGWPLNSYISKRSIRIQKSLLSARDKRMGILNELIGSVKFIKFFAWENKWIDRALDAREIEMGWMAKARINSVLLYLLWGCAPVLVSILSFFVFVMQGNQLSVSVAFTSLALFNMIRMPLNVIPTWIVQILQTGVALKRIAVFLGEDEVSAQVSSLKSPSKNTAGNEGLGLENASFKWNEVNEVDAQDGKTNADSPVASPISSPSEDGSISITINDGSSSGDVSSNGQDHYFELRDINVEFPEGQMTVVTGPTASGKTALLLALLGEMTIKSGRIIMSKNLSKVDEHGMMHAISYAAQTPWLRHQSIKDNILFDSPYDEERYNQVLECCALKPDLDMLEDGDDTEIGARGVSLSGGQKARVALARAVYARAKYVLLDDPLSAVDSHTARLLFEKLLCGPLLANRTVILVTHHVDLVLPGAHYLVRMFEGRIDKKGTIQELQDQGELENIVTYETVEAHTKEIAVAMDEPDSGDSNEDGKKSDDTNRKPRKLVKDEHREMGGVKWTVYKSYLKASSYYIWIILALLIVVNQLLGVSGKVWIKIWGEAYGEVANKSWFSLKSFATPEQEIPLDGHITYYHQINYDPLLYKTRGTFGIDWPDPLQHPLFYVGIYAAVGLGGALVSVLSVAVQYTGALRASRLLFKQLLVTVVRATFRFHDTTPQGRMLNRFGKDMDTIDMSLAGSLQAVNSSLASFFAALLTLAVVFPYFLFPALFIGYGYCELAIGYLNTGRDLRRMESNTRSPIFSHFNELLEGIVTVRAFSGERRFLDNLHRKIDMTTKMWYTFWMANRWLLVNFDVLGALSVLITTIFSIATLMDGAGLAGLCITSAMAFTSSVYWACRFWTALELDLNSVERVVEYLDLPQEPPTIIESNRVPAYWPSLSNQNALLSVENLTVKYAPDLPAVLQDISFTLKAGERVGLLGRTGSGKSTLATSLLRFVDPASGQIVIDGIDISKIGLHELRSRITFIPQDATLFSGTLRDNLDPFGEHEDSECLDVLHRVQLIGQTPSPVSSKVPSRETSRPASIIDHNDEGIRDSFPTPSTSTEVDSKTLISLDTQISPGGTNFSQGQRQLIAMARALLRRSSIVVLDEATSSIDFATDARIQTTIREQFTESLLLTVAHRLRTVIDYDRLIVLDKGQVAEFDTPWNLLQKEDGIFRNMCLRSGSLGELEAIARAKAERLTVTTI